MYVYVYMHTLVPYLDFMIAFLQVVSDILRLLILFGEIHVLVIMPFEQDVSAEKMKSRRYNKFLIFYKHLSREKERKRERALSVL